MPGDDASGGVASTGTVVHDGALTSWVRTGTAGPGCSGSRPGRSVDPPLSDGQRTWSRRAPGTSVRAASGPLAPRWNGPAVPPSGRERASRYRRARTRAARVRWIHDPSRVGRRCSAACSALPASRWPPRRRRPRASHAPSRWSLPSAWTPSWASPSGWPLPTTARSCSGRSSTRPCGPSARTARPSGSCATIDSRWRPGRASATTWRRASRSSAATRAGPAMCCAPAEWWPARTSVACASTATTATTA